MSRKKCSKCGEEKEFNLEKYCCDDCFRDYSKEYYKKRSNRIISDIPETLTCTECRMVKPITDFVNSKHGKYGKETNCKICYNLKKKISYLKKHPLKIKEEYIIPIEKKCNGCGEIKSLELFDVRNASPDKRSSHCKECCKNRAKIYIQRNKTTEKVIPETKVCYKCKIEKSKEEFYKSNSFVSGLSGICKSCSREYETNLSETLLEKRRERDRKYCEANKELVSARKKIYRQSLHGKNKYAEHKQKRKAKKKNLYHAKYDRLEIFSQFDNTCFKCGAKENLQIDHIIPIDRKGHDAEYNLCVLCKHCNSKNMHRVLHLSLLKTSLKI